MKSDKTSDKSNKMSDKSNKTSDKSNKTSDKISGKNKSDSEPRKPCLLSYHPGHTCTNVECEPSSEIDLIAQPDPPSTTQNLLTCGGIVLRQHHKHIFLSDECLDDLIITAVQNMLQQKYPAVGVLQPPSLVQKLAKEPQTGEFVQVLNIAGNHRITLGARLQLLLNVLPSKNIQPFPIQGLRCKIQCLHGRYTGWSLM